MAKKLRRVRVQASPLSLFAQILVPWLVMAVVFLGAQAAGLDQLWSIVLAVVVALYATFMVSRLARLLRARRAAALHGMDFDVRQLQRKR